MKFTETRKPFLNSGSRRRFTLSPAPRKMEVFECKVSKNMHFSSFLTDLFEGNFQEGWKGITNALASPYCLMCWIALARMAKGISTKSDTLKLYGNEKSISQFCSNDFTYMSIARCTGLRQRE